jgi:RimJ/RimL family protein N-acetyltransferase
MTFGERADSPEMLLPPVELRTARLLLRPWRAGDAVALQPILEANQEHLVPWIPTRVSTPAPVPVLADRLAGFSADFAAAREWRYGMFTPDEREVLGEIGLYPRSATGRAPYADADRVELGYWLRADATGQGLVTEAARALLAVAATLPRFSHVEVRCDARNAPSAAVPKRLGFVLASTIAQPAAASSSDPPVQLQVWTRRRSS